MVLTDWSCAISGSSSCKLDASIKYAGNSSLKHSVEREDNRYAQSTHDTFNQPQLTTEFWLRNTADVPNGPYTAKVRPSISLSSYGWISLAVTAYDNWEKFRVKFWYDIGSNTQWGRVERWSGSVWVQYGTDTNLGSGSPAAGSLRFKTTGSYSGSGSFGTGYCWFDEVEVYS